MACHANVQGMSPKRLATKSFNPSVRIVLKQLAIQSRAFHSQISLVCFIVDIEWRSVEKS